MAILPFRPLWKAARAGDLSVGDAAPDFELPKYDKSGMVRLSDFRGSRPVVLVFGSYT
ncbi:MAG: redoxin domain-containing protein [Acidobacteria bacterium]|nr:redoxin domain-containing protein [Acidobacteriota bacterium]